MTPAILKLLKEVVEKMSEDERIALYKKQLEITKRSREIGSVFITIMNEIFSAMRIEYPFFITEALQSHLQ